jgi:hypothetical protein
MDNHVASDASQAREQLRTILLSSVKARSNDLESVGDDAAGLLVLESIAPWLHGKRSIVEPLLSRLDDPRDITPGEYRNWVIIAVKLEPAIAICSEAVGQARLPMAEDLGLLPVGETWFSPRPAFKVKSPVSKVSTESPVR